ncbi:MerR family transcriptional regulator [Nonomuraea jiangxiensis]|uniref:DNA-binding transcriptional regulator, MerR family n=1 Tax=Nonomuraea jiangxiensis TaxID=633440 RepID=A0A1G9AZW3_9ACTN|nr:MerR family transcriptional regulator [Nonomuraea jiangxiensis]SDK32125.1 DNA-binding transcriptional regulator, MerR family [Nonomuraea jiangxiensis]
MTIQEAAQRSGLTAYTLRYYERIGLIRPVGRDGNGHRDYSEQDLVWLEFLTKLRTTGMPIADMCRYAELMRGGSGTAGERLEMLEEHRERVRSRIAELAQDLKALDHKIDSFRARV